MLNKSTMPRVLFFDIETIPDLEAALKHWPRLDDWPSQAMKAQVNQVLMIGYKWGHEKKAKSFKAWESSEVEILKQFSEVFESAHQIVSQNGKGFDLKFIQTRLAYYGLPFLDKKVIHVDTKQVSKANLFLLGNRLNDIAEMTRSDKKLENGGWKLWVDCYHKDPKALRLMDRYCKQDVLSLEQVYMKLRPLTASVNMNHFAAEGNCCPRCGSLSVVKKGHRFNAVTVVQRHLCNNCGYRFVIPKVGVPR